jgi:hypothetical protein
MEIFVELGQTYIEKIIETGDRVIPEILLKLMGIPEISKILFLIFREQKIS